MYEPIQNPVHRIISWFQTHDMPPFLKVYDRNSYQMRHVHMYCRSENLLHQKEKNGAFLAMPDNRIWFLPLDLPWYSIYDWFCTRYWCNMS
jgi:hypothetical protein